MEESKTIPLTRDKFVHVLNRPVSDIFSFEQILKDELENIRIETYSNFQNIERTHVKWKVCPITSLMSKLWGCEAKCMFCAEPCKNTDKDHLKFEISHHCIQHRPTGIEGFVNVADNSLAVEFCSALIQSDKKYSFHGEEFRPYKKYKERFPDWDIQPTYDTSKYWMWVMCTYKNELRERYSAKLPDIPNSWYDITKEAAIESLDV